MGLGRGEMTVSGGRQTCNQMGHQWQGAPHLSASGPFLLRLISPPNSGGHTAKGQLANGTICLVCF